MPWTLSHPAAVLPFRRWSPRPLSLAALVIGSMTPDVGYHIRRFDLSAFQHTLRGSFVACLPIGLLLMLLFYLCCRPVCHALPSPHRQALLPLCPPFPSRISAFLSILVSLLLGILTHNFCDAFTHEHGWFVDRIPWLQQRLGQIGPTTVYMFLFLQELSTVVGFAIVVIAYWLWLRRQPVKPAAEISADGWRYLFWSVIVFLAFALSLPAAIHYAVATGLHNFVFVGSILFRTAIYSSAIAVPLTLIGAWIVYVQRNNSIS
ncbi:MAG TPA: DUF4184 family protein [Chthoniobacterales bacterium]